MKHAKKATWCYKDKFFYLWTGHEVVSIPGAGICKRKRRMNESIGG